MYYDRVFEHIVTSTYSTPVKKTVKADIAQDLVTDVKNAQNLTGDALQRKNFTEGMMPHHTFITLWIKCTPWLLPFTCSLHSVGFLERQNTSVLQVRCNTLQQVEKFMYPGVVFMSDGTRRLICAALFAKKTQFCVTFIALW